MDRKIRVTCFHPALAPYRVDFFNQIAARTDFHLCLFNTNLLNQKFDPVKIKERVHFRVSYLLKGLIVRQRYFRFGIKKAVLSDCADVVISFEYSPTTCYLILMRWLIQRPFKIFIITDGNREMFDRCGGVRKILRSFVLRHVDGVIVPTGAVTDAIRSVSRPNKPVVCTIPIIYDEKSFRSGEEEIFARASQWRRKNLEPGSRVLLYVGRLAKVKNIHWLLDRVKDPRWPSGVRVYVVGGGDEEPMLKRTAASYGLEGRVVFCGRKEGTELNTLFAASDAFILPSTFEPFGAVVSEALHWGAPVAVSSHVGAQTLIRDDADGFVFDLEDRDGFFKAFGRFIAKADVWKAGRKSRMHVKLSECADNLVRVMA